MKISLFEKYFMDTILYSIKPFFSYSAISLLLFLHLSQTGFAQEEEIEQLEQRFERYSRQAPQEKIFVHTDRSFYMAGETMWFKLYVVEGSTHVPVDLSKVAYLEVIDRAQKPVLQAKIAMEKGLGNGSLYLPVSLQSGNFTLRAYTRWMKNFPAEFYFEKPITLVNSFLKPELVAQQEAARPELQFFPEGGSLVEGIRSRVAFKASNEAGKGIDFKGAVVDQHQDTMAVFEPFKFGMGSFYFTPEQGKSYRALIEGPKGDTLSYELPEVAARGYVMHLEAPSAEEPIHLTVQSNQQMRGFVYLLVHTRQALKVGRAGRMKDGKAEFILDQELLDEGISHLTVFDQAKRPVAERLYFKQPRERLHIEAKSDKEVYALREQVAIEVNAVEEAGAPALTDLSVAVYQLDSLGVNGAEGAKETQEGIAIFSYLWLSSDLKGSIEAPAYYMHQKGAEVNTAVDHLMLTHGWRRFRWEDVLKQSQGSFPFLPEYEGQILQATARDKDSGTPARGVISYLSIPGNQREFYVGKSNEKGEVHFVCKDFYGRKELILQAAPEENSQLSFQFRSPFSDQYAASAEAPFSLSPELAEKLRARSIALQVENVFMEEESTQSREPHADGSAFYGTPFKRYLLDNYTRFPTMEEVMREYVYEVKVRKRKERFHFMVFDPLTQRHFNQDPLVLLNGVPVFDLDQLMSFNPLKVESLEIVNETFFLGGRPHQGIVSFATYQGEMDGFELPPELLRVSYDGLQQSREFYVPQYEEERNSEQQRRMPDYRSLLYWSPNVQTNAAGKKTILFYSSDLEGTYQVEIQGITKEGKAAGTTFTFKAAKKTL